MIEVVSGWKQTLNNGLINKNNCIIQQGINDNTIDQMLIWMSKTEVWWINKNWGDWMKLYIDWPNLSVVHTTMLLNSLCNMWDTNRHYLSPQRQRCFQSQMGQDPGIRHQLCGHGNSAAAAHSPRPTGHMSRHHCWSRSSRYTHTNGQMHHLTYIGSHVVTRIYWRFTVKTNPQLKTWVSCNHRGTLIPSKT